MKYFDSTELERWRILSIGILITITIRGCTSFTFSSSEQLLYLAAGDTKPRPTEEELLPDGYGSLARDLDALPEHLRTEHLLQDGCALPKTALAGPTVNHTML